MDIYLIWHSAIYSRNPSLDCILCSSSLTIGLDLSFQASLLIEFYFLDTIPLFSSPLLLRN